MSTLPKISNPAAAACAGVLLALAATSASGATLTRSVTVRGEASAIWSLIGPYCAIKDWHPVVGACTVDGRTPPTRTIVTKDGKATFVERQTARSDSKRLYSYTFVSSPVPVTRYVATLSVTPSGAGRSTIVWRGVYVPDPGHEAEASEALSGIYESGLSALEARFGD